MKYLFLIHMYKKGLYIESVPMIFETETAAKMYVKNCTYDCEIKQTPIITEEDMKKVVPLLRCSK